MLDLSTTVDRKFVESFDVDDYEIETDSGWVSISHIHKTIEYDEWEIITESSKSLICADTHILFDAHYNQIFCKDCTETSYIQTKDGVEKVISVKQLSTSSNMFDITVESEDHRYYTNDILSHNTTAITVFVLWRILFNPYERVAILANKQETSIEILSRIQLAYEHLPKWLQQGVIEWNKKSFELENGSIVLAAATGSGNIRGKSVSLLIVDEMAHIDDWDDFYASVYPTISSGQNTKVILISTVNGLNHFYDFTSRARSGKNDYKLISVTWRDVPGRDEKWKEDNIRGMNGDIDRFGQEQENEYLGSSGTLIAGWKLKQLAEHVANVSAVNIEENRGSVGLKQYFQVESKHSYVIIADCSHGKGLDYSAFSVIDVTKHPYQQVCVFRNNMITPTEYSEIIHRMSRVYNDAIVLVEINDVGTLIVQTLLDTYENENILYTKHAGKMGKAICLGEAGAEPGVRTTKSVKALGCSMIKLLIEQDKLVINDFESVHELSTFSKKANSWEAEDGKKDDLAMGLVLFGWLTDQRYFKELTNIDSLKLIRDMTQEELESDLLPFGILSTAEETPAEKDYTEIENWKRILSNKGYNTQDSWVDADPEELSIEDRFYQPRDY